MGHHTGKVEARKRKVSTRMLKLADHLALARMKLIRTRKCGLSFDPSKLPTIPSLNKTEDWNRDLFKEFRKKVEQAKIVIFTVLPGIDEPDSPSTLIVSSLWGEVLVATIGDLVKCATEARTEMQGFTELQDFFLQNDTAYVTEREEKSLAMMKMMGVAMDETTFTILETWHPLSSHPRWPTFSQDSGEDSPLLLKVQTRRGEPGTIVGLMNQQRWHRIRAGRCLRRPMRWLLLH